MTSDQKKAYEWAKNQNYPSVAARYAKELAGLVDELQVASCARQEQERNAPLTLDELQEMPIHDWVWIEVLTPDAFRSKETVSAYYRKYDGYKTDEIFCCGYPGLGFGFDYADYGKAWLAYRQKQEEGTV